MEETFVYLENYLEKQIIFCKEQQTKETFAKMLGKNIQDILCENENIKIGDYVLINYNPIKIYIVKPKDTLESISQKFNKSIKEILEKNKIKNIFVGQQLFI